MPEVYSADRIFTGTGWLAHQAVVCDTGVIREVVPLRSLPAGISPVVFPGASIVPAFIDLQIYGAQDRLLAVYPETDSLYKLMDYCRTGGAAFCLPAIATNTLNVFKRSIDAVREYWKQGGAGILGLHLEGPWINPAKRGAHIESLIHTPTTEEVHELLEYGKGVIRMITLAPEVCATEILEMIHAHDIIISAGHSNATYAEAKAGFASGITTVTHLFNAMSPFQHRAPGLAGAAMDDKTVMASIIPDGHHVDDAAVRVAKLAMKERLFVITDAVTTTLAGPYQHQLVGDKYEAGGILSGSALTMNRALRNLVVNIGIELDEALRMCSLYPARVIRLDHELGMIAPGYRAAMTVINSNMEVKETISHL